MMKSVSSKIFGYNHLSSIKKLWALQHINKVLIFATSYLQVLFNGPRRAWGCGAKMGKIEVLYRKLLSDKYHRLIKEVCFSE